MRNLAFSSAYLLPKLGSRFLLGVFAFSLLTAGASTRGVAQSDRNMLDSFYNSLIETEQDRFEIERRTTPSRATPARRIVNSPTKEMEQARQILPLIARDADQLTNILYDDMARVPAIRQDWTQVLKLRARINVVADRAKGINDHLELVDELKQLDQEWRVIAHRLSSLRGLDPRALQIIDRINQTATKMSEALAIAPQFDQNQLIQETAALYADLQNLLEDIEIELGQSPDRTQLLLDGRRIQQEIRHVSLLLNNNGSYDDVVNEYKRFQKMWYPYSASLRQYNNRYLERSVRRIAHADYQILELLWMPQQVDRSQLLHLTSTLQRDVDEFFTRAPLKLLIELPDSDIVLSVSDQFYGMCENFIDTVNRGEGQQGLLDAYRSVEVGWTEFINVFRPINSQKAHLVLADIEKGIVALRESMQVNEAFDRRAAIDRIAAIEHSAVDLEMDIRRWLTTERPRFENDARRDATDFALGANRLHTQLIDGASIGELRTTADQLYDQWQRLHGYIRQCRTADRTRLLDSASRITPELVDLRSQMMRY